MKGRSKRGEKMGVEDAIVEGGSGVGGGASGWWDGWWEYCWNANDYLFYDWMMKFGEIWMKITYLVNAL